MLTEIILEEMRPLSPGEQGCFQGASDAALITEIELDEIEADLILDYANGDEPARVEIIGLDEMGYNRSWMYVHTGGRNACARMARIILDLNAITDVSADRLEALGFQQNW